MRDARFRRLRLVCGDHREITDFWPPSAGDLLVASCRAPRYPFSISTFQLMPKRSVSQPAVPQGWSPNGTGRLRGRTTNHADSISLLFFDRFGSVHAARLKQQGRRFPLFIFEILISTRRLRVSAFWVALTHRTRSCPGECGLSGWFPGWFP